MAERWYGGWDSGINSEIPSAAATKPPSCSGQEISRPPACQSVAYSTQQAYYGQGQVVAASAVQEMEFCQNTPITYPQQPTAQQEVPGKTSTTYEPTYANQNQPQNKEAPFTPPPKPFVTPQRISNDVMSEEDTAAQAIPKIIELLCDEDPIVVNHASLLVQQISKSERQKQLVIQSQQMIESIVTTLSKSKVTEVVRVLTGTLHTLSQVKQGLRVICKCGGITALVYVLSSVNCQVDHTTTNYALTMLHNALLQDSDIGGVKATARAAKGAAVLTQLLSNNNPKFLAILIDCIHVLCLGHSESKLAVVTNGGPQHLVRILRGHTYEKLLWTVSRLVKVLSTCQQNKTAIIEAGGMHALTSQLSQPSSRLVMNCLWSLRNLSDAATKQTGLDHLMHFLLHVLSTIRDKDMVSCSIGVLSNLTCNNQHNKIVICNSHGIEIIFHLLTQLNLDQHTDIMEPAIFTLRHLTSRHPASEQAQATFKSVGGVVFLSNLLNVPWSSIRPPIVKAACGLMRNLALVETNHATLLENGCLHRLADVLIPSAQELLNAAEAGAPAPKSHDGTRLDDLAEQAAGAIHALLKDPNCRKAAQQTHLPQALVQLSTCKIVNDNTRKQAHGALTELAAVTSTSSTASAQAPSKTQERGNPNPQSQQQQQFAVNSQQGPPSVPTPSATPMVYQPQSQEPRTPTRQQPQSVQPAQYQQLPPSQTPSQEATQQSGQLQQQQHSQPQQTQQAHSLPQSPYHQPPRMMSTQPSVSVPPTPQQTQTQHYNHPQHAMMVPQQEQQIMPAHQQSYSYDQYSQMQVMQQQQQQQRWYQDPQYQQQMGVPPQAHQMNPQHYHQQQQQYAANAQYVATPQNYGF